MIKEKTFYKSFMILALSLALQNILSNLFSGVTVLVTRPFTTGDYVEFGNVAGRISAVCSSLSR